MKNCVTGIIRLKIFKSKDEECGFGPFRYCIKTELILTVINVAAHIVCGLIPRPQLSATEASPHPETSPAETRRSHTQSPAKQTHISDWDRRLACLTE